MPPRSLPSHKSTPARGFGSHASWTAAIAAAVLATVFVLPWLLPAQSAQVVSDSQALGFANRVSMIGLAAGLVAMFLLTWRFPQGNGTAEEPLIFLNSSTDGETVSPRLIVAGIVTAFVTLIVLATALKGQAIGDAGYFIDRLLLIDAGAVPYSQVEFSYGPLLIYTPLLMWQLLKWTGMSMYAFYFVWVATCCVAGLMMAAFLVNRLRLDRSMRNATFLLVGGIIVLPPTVLVSYSPIRFLLPFVLLAWVTGRVVEARGGILRNFLPLLACVVAAAVSPDMGVALLVAFVAALIGLIMRGQRAAQGPLVILLSGIAVAAVALASRPTGTIGNFVGGAFWFPVLPGLPALTFVGSMLLIAWAVGGSSVRYRPRDTALHWGWFALTAVLVAPAFGRADFGHLYWNGLGAVLACTAIVGLRWNAAGRYLATIGVVFGSAFVVYAAMTIVPSISDAKAREAVASESEIAPELAAVKSAAFVGFLPPVLGMELAAKGDLVPLYTPPGLIIAASDFRKAMGQLDQADSIILPTSQLTSFQEAAEVAEPDGEGIVMAVPRSVGGVSTYGLLLGVPVTFTGRDAVFDPVATFGLVLKRDWEPRKTVGQYTVLSRR